MYRKPVSLSELIVMMLFFGALIAVAKVLFSPIEFLAAFPVMGLIAAGYAKGCKRTPSLVEFCLVMLFIAIAFLSVFLLFQGGTLGAAIITVGVPGLVYSIAIYPSPDKFV